LPGYPVTVSQWQQFIRDFSAELLRLRPADHLYDVDDAGYTTTADITDARRASGWLGHDPASEDEVLAAEQRLGVRLPPSYRNFLLASNGLISGGVPLLPVQQTDWLRNWPGMGVMLDRAWTPDVYGDDMCAMFRRALWPIPDADGDYWLLDPGDIGADGEWRAYIWWCSDGGTPEPYPSFGAMLVSERTDLVRAFSAPDADKSLTRSLIPWAERAE
jgi:hypothetical protein